MAMRKGVPTVARVTSRRIASAQTRKYTYHVDDPPSYQKYPPAPRPEGVPDTWCAKDIETDLGWFEDDCFPPALPGETLEEYCRRVPNVWSPCSRSTDVVDCPVYTTLEFAEDILCEDHQFTERPLVKIPPLDSDWHAMHEVEMNLANPLDPYLFNGVKAPQVTERNRVALAAEGEEIIRLIRDGAARLGHGHWFQSDNFADFWVELTGKSIEETPLEEHMNAWLEANPGMTLNDIEKAWDPGFVEAPELDRKFDPNRVPHVPEGFEPKHTLPASTHQDQPYGERTT